MHIWDVSRPTEETGAALVGNGRGGAGRGGVPHEFGLRLLCPIWIATACPQPQGLLLESGSSHENIAAYFSGLQRPTIRLLVCIENSSPQGPL